MPQSSVTHAMITEIKYDFSTGMKKTEICRKFNLHSQTVNTILRNAHHLQRPPRPKGYVRCPSCRAKVKMPCLACKLNGAKNADR